MRETRALQYTSVNEVNTGAPNPPAWSTNDYTNTWKHWEVEND